jgi:hypothetical protein
MASKKDTPRSPINTPAAWLTFDELIHELETRCRKYVFIGVIEDRKDGGLQTTIRRSETAGDAILLMEHAIECCEIDWTYNTFGPAGVKDDDDLEAIG